MNIYPTPADLTNWIASSHKGDRFQYHLGHLIHDRAFRVTLAATEVSLPTTSNRSMR